MTYSFNWYEPKDTGDSLMEATENNNGVVELALAGDGTLGAFTQTDEIEKVHGLGIGSIIYFAKSEGRKGARKNWNGKNMYIYYVPRQGNVRDYIMMRTANGEDVPWVCSQSDMLEDDWYLVD